MYLFSFVFYVDRTIVTMTHENDDYVLDVMIQNCIYLKYI